MKEKITLVIDDGKGNTQELDLKHAFFGGKTTDEGNYPVGGYVGEFKNPVAVITALEQVNRAALKAMREFHFPEHAIAETFKLAVVEAIREEKKADPENNIDIQTHKKRMERKKRK